MRSHREGGRRKSGGLRDRTWVCPHCGGVVRPSGPTEREPLRCDDCGVRYRHPRMALLLSLVLPGLGSIYLGHRLWGAAILVAGTAAFLGALGRLAVHFTRVLGGAAPDLRGMIAESAIGVGAVLLSYGLDLLRIWLRRDRLVRR